MELVKEPVKTGTFYCLIIAIVGFHENIILYNE